jgi:[acyl-carrier-protein] S-malonyltransferase
MGKELCREFAAAREVFEEAEQALGFPLSKLCFSGPGEDLKLTKHAQPAILTASIAALRVLESVRAMTPLCVAGHSLGEYSALVSAGAIGFTDAVKIVHERGKLMQDAVPPGAGAMAAVVGLATEAVESLCRDAAQGEVVALAGLNGAEQLVIAGAKGAVLRAVALADERGAKRAVELPVSAPFHCPLMAPAAEGLRKVLDGVAIRAYSTPVITNVEAAVNLDPARVKRLLVEQVTRPVRWEESIKAIEGLGCEQVLELGPGKVLTGLVKRISRALKTYNLDTPKDLERFLIQPAA